MRALATLFSLLLMPLTGMAAPQLIKVENDAGLPLANAVVSVMVKGAKATAAPGTVADMAQRNKAFAPTLLVIQTGSLVNFPNFDTVRHHVYSFSAIKKFEIKLYSGTPTDPILFDKPGTATLGCNIHDRMLAYIHVVDTPYFGITDANGELMLDLPKGEHRVRIWTPAMGELKPDIEQSLKTGPAAMVRVAP
jgi:plastocyanin